MVELAVLEPDGSWEPLHDYQDVQSARFGVEDESAERFANGAIEVVFRFRLVLLNKSPRAFASPQMPDRLAADETGYNYYGRPDGTLPQGL